MSTNYCEGDGHKVKAGSPGWDLVRNKQKLIKIELAEKLRLHYTTNCAKP